MASYDAVLAAIRESLDYEEIYGEHLRLIGRGRERMAFCVFHENRDTPALSVNVEEGIYHCKNPECAAQGDVLTFLQKTTSRRFGEVVELLARKAGVTHLLPNAERRERDMTGVEAEQAALLAAYVPPPEPVALGNGAGTRKPKRSQAPDVPPIDPQVAHAYHRRLLDDASRLEYLASRRGLTLATVQRHQIGHDGQRYTLPVFDRDGLLRNIRRYLPDCKEAAAKMRSWREGYGTARLYPLDHFDGAEPCFIFEGELDALLARQLGLNAVTGTGGAGTWRDAWNDQFAGRTVHVCYDADKEGLAGARKVARALATVAAEVRIVRLPLAEKGADFTDYIVKHGHTVEDFLALVEHTPVWRDDGTPDAHADDEPPLELHLSRASEAEYYNKAVRINVVVSGKHTSPYLVPQEVTVGCPTDVRGTLPMCERCAVNRNNGPVKAKIPVDDNTILSMVDVPVSSLNRVAKLVAGVPNKCPVARHDVDRAQNVEEVQLIPELEFSDSDTPYVTRTAYYLGHGLRPNTSYVMTGITVPEPQKQFATHIIHTAVPAQSNLDSFRLDSDTVERLKVFRPERPGVDGLWDQMHRIHDDLERVVRVYERRDLLTAVDLVYHSVLGFTFQGERLARGWSEVLIIGDSRTGKTTAVKRMQEHYRAGEFGSGENTSVAGLIGGLHQIGTSWALQWGRVPLNDRRLFILDEAGDLPVDQMARLSSMRSSGVAEIIKVHTERTNARTRQVWISNPRKGTLGEYSQGVLAVKELMGSPADIARFDLVVTAATGDVALKTVNAPREKTEPQTFTSELCHQRVMWAWSRTAEQVVWAEDAPEAVLMYASRQGEQYRYATAIPLVEPNEQKVKLARLAVATAVCFFSSSDDGAQVIVRPEHVQFAHDFLESLYQKPSLAFTDYAEQQQRQYVLAESGAVEVIVRRSSLAARQLMEQELMTQKDLMEILGYDDLKETREAISTLREAGFLRRQGTSGYVKTPAAILWLRRMLSTGQTSRLAPQPAAVVSSPAVGALPSSPDDDPPW